MIAIWRNFNSALSSMLFLLTLIPKVEDIFSTDISRYSCLSFSNKFIFSNSMAEDMQVTNVPSSSSNRVLWSREMECKFLDLLLEQVQLGQKAEGRFKKEAWTAIEQRFNEDLKQNLIRDNLKNKIKTWKMGFRMMKDLRNMSGFSWNEATQSVDAEDSVWNELLKVNCSLTFI